MGLRTQLIGRFRGQPFPARYAELVAICVVVNLAGAAATEAIGISIFFFDMIGTATAALLTGITGGVIVAILSSILGTFIVGNEYYVIFGIINGLGAILWGALPRTGIRIFGADIFNPESHMGYGRLFLRIAVLGAMVGLACAAASFTIQYYVLDFGLQEEIISATSAGSATGRNNAYLAAVLHYEGLLGSGGHRPTEVLILSLIISNVFDKIIATVTAVILIFSFAKLHNFEHQNVSEARPHRHRINGKVAYLVALGLLVLSFQLIEGPWHSADGRMAIAIAIAFSAFLLFADVRFFSSIERTQTVSPDCWFNDKDKYEFVRDVFEDTLKLFLVLFTFLNIYASGITLAGRAEPTPSSVIAQPNPGTTIIEAPRTRHMMIDGTRIPYDPRDFYEFALKNLLILTAFRYLFVMLMRLSGRFH